MKLREDSRVERALYGIVWILFALFFGLIHILVIVLNGVITKTQITAWGVFYQQGILLSLAIGLVGTTVFDVHSCRDVAKDGMLHLAGHILAPFMVILSATIGYCIVVLNAAGTPEAGAPTQLGIMATALLYTTIAKMHVKHASYSARQRELAEASRT